MIRNEFLAFLILGTIGILCITTGIIDLNKSIIMHYIIIYPIVLLWITRHINMSGMKKKEYENFFYYSLRNFLNSKFKADERENFIVYKTTHFSIVILIFFITPIYGLRNEHVFGYTVTELLVKFNIYDIWGWLLLCLFYVIWGTTGLVILSREDGSGLEVLKNKYDY